MRFVNWSEENKIEYVKEAKSLCEFLSLRGFESHLQFGALLGLVRERKLIDNDTDIDICYLSKKSAPVDACRECYELYEIFRDCGMLVRYWNRSYRPKIQLKNDLFGQAHVRVEKYVIDLFTSWVDKKGNYWTCQYGNFGKTKFKKATFYGYEFTIPTETDKILTRLFGDWRTPREDKPRKHINRRCYMI